MAAHTRIDRGYLEARIEALRAGNRVRPLLQQLGIV